MLMMEPISLALATAVVSGEAEDRVKVLSGVDVAFLFRSLRDLCFSLGVSCGGPFWLLSFQVSLPSSLLVLMHSLVGCVGCGVPFYGV